ncbi:hypothetical protein ACLK1T_01510 [Escherichia coli]
MFPVRPLQDNLRVAMNNWRVILSSSRACLIPDIEDESQAPPTIWTRQRSADGDIESDVSLAADPLTWRLWSTGTRCTLIITLSHRIFMQRASSSHIQYQTLREHFA